MKNKKLAITLVLASLALPVMNGVAYAEETPAMTPAVEMAKSAAPEGDELQMFRFIKEMDRQDFVKKGMGLDADQEKKFLDVYFVYNAELKKLNDKRVEIIKDYVDSFANMTDANADKLVKRSLEYHKQRSALLAKYYGKVAKATSKIIAARFLQVENVLYGYSDVVIGASLPLMSK